MKRILVFGGKGQLGQCLAKVAQERNMIEMFLFLSQEEGDILDEISLSLLFHRENPEYVINCAAYTAVDQAENERDLCELINKTGSINLAKYCQEIKATLIHISTDFVFEGNIPHLLNEESPTNPINVYGRTKLDGELGIARLLNEHIIIRTSWLYSEIGNNFMKTMKRLASERTELGVIVDQAGTPTYAIDLANTIIDIVKLNHHKYGVYHYSNEGVASWYDFAKAIFDISQIKIKLNPIYTSAYPTKAKRPMYSVMDKTKIKSTFELQIPYWRDSLVKCIEELNKIS
ncbi:dTDP-4-dehydrorhamnose reductase [Pedobacter sp. BAL39]|nr:dTDP-4-dehydrorhamnose reductase [Pedobacter sp. BAL39]